MLNKVKLSKHWPRGVLAWPTDITDKSLAKLNFVPPRPVILIYYEIHTNYSSVLTNYLQIIFD